MPDPTLATDPWPQQREFLRQWQWYQNDSRIPAAVRAALLRADDLDRRDRRIVAALADLDGVMPGFLAPETHAGECWRIHVGCLAARIAATLTGEDRPQ